MSEKIVQLNEEVIKGQFKELVRGSVEETLNELLEAEAEKLTHDARMSVTSSAKAAAAAIQPQPHYYIRRRHSQGAKTQGDFF